jgi:hypothetical protein
MGKKRKITLSVDSDIYSDFQKFCEDRDLMLSKRIERLIKKHMEEEKNR